MIERQEPRPGITLLRLAHGKANALDLELLRALKETCSGIDAAATRAVVLTGRGTIFSAGVDLYRVLDGGLSRAGTFAGGALSTRSPRACSCSARRRTHPLFGEDGSRTGGPRAREVDAEHGEQDR